MVKVIVADNSGPSYELTGEVAPQFSEALFRWVTKVYRKHFPKQKNPTHVGVSKDGTRTKLEWDWDGNHQTNSVKIVQENGKLTVSVAGDAQEMDPPSDSIFTSGQYTDNEAEAYGILDGKTLTLGELLKIAKRSKAHSPTSKKQKRKPS
jgi:hypothetical protein